jgi:hypothetical protein
MNILQVFADAGAENPTLSNYGDITRVSINAQDNQWSDAIKADATHFPIRDDVTFDIGFFHPPCGGVSPMSEIGSGSREDWPDLIPESREIAHAHCDEWVIENKPRKSLDETVVLDGHMFGLGISYERAFETSFPVEQPAQQDRLAETSPFFYTERPHGWWAGVKGTSTAFSKEHIAKNTIPGAYIDYLMRHYAKAHADPDAPDYSDYDKQMTTKRNKMANSSLSEYNND